MAVNIKNNNETIDPSDIKELLTENLELTRETHKMVKKIKNHIVLEEILNVLKILVIVIPIVLGIIYLPRWFEQFKANPDIILNNLGIGNIMQSLTNQIDKQINKGVDLNNIDPKQLEQYKKLIK